MPFLPPPTPDSYHIFLPPSFGFRHLAVLLAPCVLCHTWHQNFTATILKHFILGSTYWRSSLHVFTAAHCRSFLCTAFHCHQNSLLSFLPTSCLPFMPAHLLYYHFSAPHCLQTFFLLGGLEGCKLYLLPMLAFLPHTRPTTTALLILGQVSPVLLPTYLLLTFMRHHSTDFMQFSPPTPFPAILLTTGVTWILSYPTYLHCCSLFYHYSSVPSETNSYTK